ncbi:inner-membrane translocator [Ketogulonicigenium vulgare Y25]|uniref:High-affinity branched-chain amino acid transport system permease protein livh n=1 Tax=Ketogulonicigenium vulgare (strain WSH-001) TaxID=759362 RepID=F9Y8P6_KETVW|nr:branched-chain amino acid ABC transporter permease [Ketogulonicigenium vulgare]ADO43037.1 inner-membrane translocator [Ketogulonicigenium vulgare Y25]AEM41215.1 High-affinity branched-chain amino acid transport system permease protein livh [Ketogulonicigenium vulgare WSH-001]ALJ81357.1 branched-chain amino acid ABC transporter permease [Ketogulonicigenium vulgare]AOZ54946.1 inner-membrane translocator [Ketogulonicigenium vulgare]
MLLTALISGLVLGGTYALVAMGLTLQYGISRIMNLAYGEFVIFAAFCAFVLFTAYGISPLVGMLLVLPAAFVVGYVLYGVMMQPLVKRSGKTGALDVDAILATFGLMFVVQGVMLVTFGANYTSYSYMNFGVNILGASIAANRLLAFVLAVVIGGALYMVLARTRWGTAIRAVAVAPEAAPLVGINVNHMARLAFALGMVLAAAGGIMISMYQTFNASMGVVFAMKALIIVIMGGQGNLLGALVAGLMLGLVETFVATYIDPGLTLAATYAIFLAVLLWRPSGLFGKGGRA